MTFTKVKNWVKRLFAPKLTEADIRARERPIISDEFVARVQKRHEAEKYGGARMVNRVESRAKRNEILSKPLKPSYPPTRPTDGYQPSAKPLAAPPTARSYVSDPVDRHDSGLTDALLIANLLQSSNSTRSTTSETCAPSVKSSWSYPETSSNHSYAPMEPAPSPTVEPSPPPPAPAPSYSPSYDSSPSYSSAPSYSNSDSYSSSDSFSSSSSGFD